MCVAALRGGQRAPSVVVAAPVGAATWWIGLLARQFDGTALALPIASVHVQVMTAAASPVPLVGINASTGAGVAPVLFVTSVMAPSSAMLMFATYGLVATGVV